MKSDLEGSVLTKNEILNLPESHPFYRLPLSNNYVDNSNVASEDSLLLQVVLSPFLLPYALAREVCERVSIKIRHYFKSRTRE